MDQRCPWIDLSTANDFGIAVQIFLLLSHSLLLFSISGLRECKRWCQRLEMRCAVLGSLSEKLGVQHGGVGEDGGSQVRWKKGPSEEAPGEFRLVDHWSDDVFGRAEGLVEGAAV